MSEPRQTEQKLSTERGPQPGTLAWLSRMKSIAHEINHAAAHENWYVVEIKAHELAIMCEMRRGR